MRVKRGSTVLWWLLTSGILLWMLLVLPGYYVVHKPFIPGVTSPPPEITLSSARVFWGVLGALADVALLVLSLVVVTSWGVRLIRWIGLAPEADEASLAVGATLGLGLLGTAVLGLGAIGGLHRWVAYLLLFVLGVSGIPEIATIWRRIRSQAPQVPRPLVHWSGLYAGLIALLALGLALLPPTSWDALVYHLLGPRLYVEAHRLLAIPENLYLNWPAQIEMLFTWGLLLKGDILAKLFHWIFWPLTTILTYHLARRTGGKQVGRWSVVLWSSVPFAADLAGIAYVDLALTAFVLAGAYAFLQWADSRNGSWLTLSAVFLGLAIATKYSAAVWLGCLLVLVVYHSWRHHMASPGSILGRAIRYGTIASLVVGPWLAKNWIVTGNPFYPFLFDGVGWNATRHNFLVGSGGGYSPYLVDYITLPWVATVLGISGTAAFDATTGPLLLLLVPLVLFVGARPRQINYALGLLAAQGIYFAVTVSRYVYLVETRLLLPIFPLLSIIGAFVLVRLPALDRKAVRLSRIVTALVLLVLAVNIVTAGQAFLATRPFAALVGLESREDYLARRLGAHYQAMSYLNRDLPPGSRIFFLWEPRSYYSMQPSRPDATLDNLAQLHLDHGDADTALAALRSQGFTHLLYYRAGLAFLLDAAPRPPTLTSLFSPVADSRSHYPLSEQDLALLTAMLAQCSLEQSVGAVYDVYRIP